MASSKKALIALALLLAFAAGLGTCVAVSSPGTERRDESLSSVPSGTDGVRATVRGLPRPARVERHADDASVATSNASSSVSGPDPKTQSTPDVTAKAEAAAASTPEPPEVLDGRVVDSETDEPLAGARVVYFIVLADGRTPGGVADTSDADGKFANRRPKWNSPGARFELRVSKTGYEDLRMPIVEASPIVRLRRQTRAPLPGRVLGVVRDKDDHPLAGVVLVEGHDDAGRYFAQFAVADAAGSFVLEGVPAMHWKFTTLNAVASAEVTLPDGGEARMQLVVRSDPRSEEERLHGIDGDRVGFGKQGALTRDESGHRPAPREVVVSGLGDEPGTCLRAALQPRLYWRVEAKNGEARFPALSPGTWTLVLVRTGQPDAEMTVDVPAGDGPLQIEFAGK